MKTKTGCRDLIPSADQICKHTHTHSHITDQNRGGLHPSRPNTHTHTHFIDPKRHYSAPCICAKTVNGPYSSQTRTASITTDNSLVKIHYTYNIYIKPKTSQIKPKLETKPRSEASIILTYH